MTNAPNDSGHTICRDCLECIDCGLCSCGKSTFSFKHMEHAIRSMTPRSRLFNVVKREMQRRGHWKNLARGVHAPGSGKK